MRLKEDYNAGYLSQQQLIEITSSIDSIIDILAHPATANEKTILFYSKRIREHLSYANEFNSACLPAVLLLDAALVTCIVLLAVYALPGTVAAVAIMVLCMVLAVSIVFTVCSLIERDEFLKSKPSVQEAKVKSSLKDLEVVVTKGLLQNSSFRVKTNNSQFRAEGEPGTNLAQSPSAPTQSCF